MERYNQAILIAVHHVRSMRPFALCLKTGDIMMDLFVNPYEGATVDEFAVKVGTETLW